MTNEELAQKYYDTWFACFEYFEKTGSTMVVHEGSRITPVEVVVNEILLRFLEQHGDPAMKEKRRRADNRFMAHCVAIINNNPGIN